MIDPLPLVIQTLDAAYRAVYGAGDAAKHVTNTSIDISTRGDEIAGEAMVNVLRKYPYVGVAFTEEQGSVVLNETGQYSAILDDIDGTKNYKEGFGMLPHGSIAGIFEGRDPRFQDCRAAGYLDFPSGNLFFAEKGGGAHIIERYAKKLQEGEESLRRSHYNDGEFSEKLELLKKALLDSKMRIKTTGRKELFTGNKMTLLDDQYMLDTLVPAIVEYSTHSWLGDFRCTAIHLSMISGGSADVFVAADNAYNLNKKRTGEEIGPGYLLVKEAGGALVDWNGQDLGSEKVGMGEKKTFHFVAAATPELAQAFAEDMRKKPAIRHYMEKKGLYVPVSRKLA